MLKKIAALWNRPSASMLRAAEHVQEAAQLRAELEQMRVRLFGKEQDIEKLRDRGPEPGTVELTIRAWSPSGQPIAAKFQMHRIQLEHIDHEEVGEFLARRCRELYHSVARKE